MRPSVRALIWLILPTYAEAAGLPGVIAGARKALAHEDLHILVVDDASPDGTGALAEKLGAEVLHRPRKLGLGSAYVAGFTRALAHDPELVCQMDADGSHDPADLRRLIALAPAPVRSQGYAFQVELTYRALRRGLRVVDTPILFRERGAR